MKTSLMMNFTVDKENNSINVEREFAAPVSNVWKAWTESKYLDQWWAPKPWRAETKSQDFREGGRWRYCMCGPEGEKHWALADYKSITQGKSFSAHDGFSDENGNLNMEMPRSHWTNTFTAINDDKTLVKVRIQYDTLADLEMIISMGMKEGFTMAMGNLDELIEQGKI